MVWTLIFVWSFVLSVVLLSSFHYYKTFSSGPLYGFSYKVQKMLKETVLRIGCLVFLPPTLSLSKGACVRSGRWRKDFEY